MIAIIERTGIIRLHLMVCFCPVFRNVAFIFTHSSGIRIRLVSRSYVLILFLPKASWPSDGGVLFLVPGISQKQSKTQSLFTRLNHFTALFSGAELRS